MKKKLLKLLEVILESVCYLIITYTLSSMYTSFKLHWFAILFRAADIFALMKYYSSVNRKTGSNVAAVVALVCCFLAFVFLAAKIGYIQGEFRQFTSLW